MLEKVDILKVSCSLAMQFTRQPTHFFDAVMQSMCNNFVSQFDAELSQLRGEALEEANGFAKAQEPWSQEKASLEAEVQAMRTTYKVSIPCVAYQQYLSFNTVFFPAMSHIMTWYVWQLRLTLTSSSTYY